MSLRFGRFPTSLVLLAALFLTLVSLANAELTASGDLFVSFNGAISPPALPRNARAPIAISFAGVVRTPSGESPPPLRQIAVAFNRAGHLDTRGLPRCPASRLASTSIAGALAACGPALIGSGSFAASTAYPEQSAFPSHGHILAFNAISDGHRAVLAHIFGAHPVPITRVLTFRISHIPGTYGTLLSANLPPSLNRYGYLKRIDLSLYRRFTYRGRLHSYLSAACSAPAGFPGAVFPLARGSMSFADGQTLSTAVTRSCRVAK